MQTPTNDIRSILDPLDVPKDVKAKAWDAFHASRNDAEFRFKFAGINLPKEAKASLWDAKQFTPEQTIQKITQPLPVQEAPGLLEPITGSIKAGAQAVGDVVKGFGKGAAETALNAVKLLGRPDNPMVLPGLPGGMNVAPPASSVPAEATAPTNTAQSVGKFGERIAEFVAGGELLAPLKAAVAAKTASPIIKAGVGAATEGVAAAGVTAAQQGTTENILPAALTGAALSAAIPAALKLGGKLGKKIESVLIKPTKADIEGGFKVENVFKYKLGGTLEQTLKVSQEKLDNLTAMAKQLRTGGNPVDLNKALTDTARDLAAMAPRNQGMNQQILNALKKEADELDMLVNAGHIQPNGAAAVDVAHEVLQSVGERGAWTYGFRDPDSVAAEKVANIFYTKLKNQILGAVPNGTALAEVNKAMTDIIPIKQAIIRRIPVEARNQAMHLSDIVFLSNGSIPLGILNRALRYGPAANAMVRAGEKAEPLGALGARVGAGLTQQQKQ
jgi:hypothetical protein